MTDDCREAPRGSRAITVELSLYDVPTQNCNVHKEVEICGASGLKQFYNRNSTGYTGTNA